MSLLIILASACLAWCYPLQTFISALVAFLIWPSNPKPLFGIYNQPGKMHNSIKYSDRQNNRGNKNWPPSMKVKKLEFYGNKSGLKGCKWASLNVPGTESPLSHPLFGLDDFPFPIIGPLG